MSALLDCDTEQTSRSRKIHVSRYTLYQMMQTALSTREDDQMWDSPNRLTSTTSVATTCVDENLAKSWVSEAFHGFDRSKLYQERKESMEMLGIIGQL
jgi:hypothetical protein